jgi:uncharacterized protein (DUF302 family)
MKIDTSPVQVAHVRIEIPIAYDILTAHLERILGRFDHAVQDLFAKDPEAAAERIEAMAGEQGLMIFWTMNHGALLALDGGARKAKRYLIGNPLIALQMTKHDIRAGLYAPLTALVYALDASTVCVEFDRPSSLFGQFGDQAVTEIGLSLDQKLTRAIEIAADPLCQRSRDSSPPEV